MATSTLGSGTLVLAGTTSGTTTVTATAVAGTTTLTLPAATDTLVGKATTDTLTNKTLTSPTLTGVVTFDAGTAAAPAITTTGDTNTGIFFPAADTIAFAEGGAEVARFDSSGNFGLGVTPSAWGSFIPRAIELPNGVGFSSQSNAPVAHFSANAYYDGSWRYKATGVAARYSLGSDTHAWSTAASGTAGNAITFTQAMTLDSSGNLLVGTTSAGFSTSGRGLIEVNGTSESLIALKRNGSATTAGYIYQNATDMRIVQRENLPMLFYTNDNERARIDSSGNLLVGTTTALQSAIGNGIQIKPDSAGGFINIGHNSSSSGYGYMQFLYGSTATVIGSISQSGTTAVAYNTSSDYRLKNTIAPMTGALAKVAALKPVTYKWNADGSDGEGFIAHELAEVCPHAVTGEKDAVDEEGTPRYQGVDTSFLVATLTAAIQEQQALITTLTARITALESA